MRNSAALFYIIGGHTLLAITFGDSFKESGQLLSLLAFGLPLVFMNMVSSMLLECRGREKLVLPYRLQRKQFALQGGVLPALMGLEGAAIAVLLGITVAVTFFTLSLVSSTKNEPIPVATVQARAA